MDKLARRTRELLTPPMSPRQICSILNRVLFHEYGFRGAGKDFENPENSFLHRVIERRQGLPITLSVLFILIARRIGLELEPIGLPEYALWWVVSRTKDRFTWMLGPVVKF